MNKPWLSAALKQSIKEKNKLYILQKNQNDDERVLYYKKYRNKLNQLIRSAERKHYHDLLIEHKSNIKKSWQIIKSVIKKRKYKLPAKKFHSNGIIVDDGNVISNKFNNFFVNVGHTLAMSIPSSYKNPTDYISYSAVNAFYFDPVTENEICKIIGTFKDSAAGWDDMRANVIRHIKEIVCIPLKYICNLSLSSGIFPHEMKIANVVPIHKANDDMVFSNYRPVSVLPVFSKLLERLVYNRPIMFINNNSILYENQFGFQKGKSTHFAIMLLTDKITEALDRGECLIGVFLDFSKAFDTVDHDNLLEKLGKYGIQGVELQWFCDYLSNRMQYVTYNNHKSQKEKITCGVPQGSILGPLLFLLYINDQANVSSHCFSILFADDTNMFISGRNLDVLCNQLNEDLREIQEWLNCNKLSLNVLKTHYMIFTPRNKKIEDIDIQLYGVSIQRVFVTKFLGVPIDCNLSWKCHIEYTCKKLSKCVGILCKARKKFAKSSLINLYYSFAYPYLIYCNHVWGNNYPTNLEKLYLVQKKLIRIITCSLYRAHTEPLCIVNRILNVTDINTYIIGIFMYDCMNENVPNSFQIFFQINRNIHDHDVRSADDIHVPYGRLDIRRFSIRITGANVWNTLPEHIKSTSSIHLFKRSLKNHLLDRRLQS